MPLRSGYADLLVAMVCIGLVVCFLGSRDIEKVRERRIAGTAADVADHGHWLLPELEGKPRLRFCSFWLTGNFVFFAALASQPIHYLLPLVPALGVIEAVLLHRFLSRIEAGDLVRRDWVIAAALNLCFVGLSVGTSVSLYSRAHESIARAVVTGLCLSIPACLAARLMVSKPKGAYKLFVVTGVLCVAIITGWIEPRVSARKSIASFAHALVHSVPPHEPVHFTDTEEALPFYAQRDF